jgi:cytoskeletal protein RodZ
MLDRFDDRTLEIATVVVVVLIALVILCYLTIYLNPQFVLNPFPPPTATAVARATSTPPGPTWTPSPTSSPSPTFTATPTWTPSPTATSTPTPLPPTLTPTPTNTATPVPTNTRRPPPPQPTRPPPTPTPWPYYYQSAGGRGNCAVTGVYGYVLDASGLAEANVQMRVGNDQGWRADVWTDANGFYRFDFTSEPVAGKWFVRVFKGGVPRSFQFWWQTSAGCEGPGALQEVEIVWRRR